MTYCWIDTHCHLDAPEFGAESAAVRQRARAEGVGLCVIPAVDAGNFDAVRRLAESFGDGYALGIHPLRTGQAQPHDLDRLDTELTERRNDPALVAVGEIGIDGFIEGLDLARQETFFAAQLKLARKHGLPVVLHSRRAVDRVLMHLRRTAAGAPWQGIAHAFNGSRQQADECLRLGLKLGFGGAVTFDRALQLRRLATSLPLAALVMETDAPDIAPHWLYRTRAERAAGAAPSRNEPGQLPRIGASIATLRGIEPAALAEVSSANALQALPKLKGLFLNCRSDAQ
ncbi:MAG: TatD family hydrolase [Variovorax sp.]